jgi:serine/threonine protein kinase
MDMSTQHGSFARFLGCGAPATPPRTPISVAPSARQFPPAVQPKKKFSYPPLLTCASPPAATPVAVHHQSSALNRAPLPAPPLCQPVVRSTAAAAAAPTVVPRAGKKRKRTAEDHRQVRAARSLGPAPTRVLERCGSPVIFHKGGEALVASLVKPCLMVKLWYQSRSAACLREVVVNRYLRSSMPPNEYDRHVRQLQDNVALPSPYSLQRLHDEGREWWCGKLRGKEALCPYPFATPEVIPATWEGFDSSPPMKYTPGYSVYTRYTHCLGDCTRVDDLNLRNQALREVFALDSDDGHGELVGARLLDIVVLCLEGLRAHHAADVLLVDIKPANIFLNITDANELEEVVFGDYGHAAILSEKFEWTSSEDATARGYDFRVKRSSKLRGSVAGNGGIGTHGYLPQEAYSLEQQQQATSRAGLPASRVADHLRRQGEWSASSDIYSLGLTLVELVSALVGWRVTDQRSWVVSDCFPQATKKARAQGRGEEADKKQRQSIVDGAFGKALSSHIEHLKSDAAGANLFKSNPEQWQACCDHFAGMTAQSSTDRSTLEGLISSARRDLKQSLSMSLSS